MAAETRKPAPTDRASPQALHECLRYIAGDARDRGMEQTARMLDLAAQLALQEARVTNM